MLRGKCHCGEIRFEVSGGAVHSSLCHCRDCGGQSGAPATARAMIPTNSLTVEGVPQESKEAKHIQFWPVIAWRHADRFGRVPAFIRQ